MRRWHNHLAAVLTIVLAATLAAGCGGREPEAAPVTAAVEQETGPEPTPAASPTPTRTPIPPEELLVTPIPERATRSALTDIRERGQVRVGVLYNYPPMAFLADNGQVQGYEAALARRMAELWGAEIVFVQVTRQTRLPMLYEGQIDLIAGAMPHRRELQQFVEFSNSTFQGGYAVLVRENSGTDMAAALGSGTVGVLGSDAREAVRLRSAELGVDTPVMEFSAPGDAVAALGEGRVQAVIGRREQLMLPAQTNEQAAMLDAMLVSEPYAFAVRRGDTALRDLINLTLQQIIIAGEIGSIYSQNLYGLPADIFDEVAGEPSFTFETFPAEVAAQASAVERIRAGQTLRVAGLDLSPEPALYDSQPIYDGYNRAVINEMARRWGVSVAEIPASEGEAGLSMLASEEADLVAGVRADRALIGQVALSQPYYTRGLRLIHLRDVTVFNVLDLEFKPAYVVQPVELSRAIVEDNNQFPRVQEAASLEAAFEGLLDRAVYAVVGDEYALALMADADPLVVFDSQRYRPREVVIALPVDDADLLALVNFTLQDMQIDGTLDALREQYFGPYVPEGEELDDLVLETWPGDGGYLGVGG